MEINSNKIGNVIRIIDNRTIIVNVGRPVLDVGEEIKVYESLDTLRDLDGTELCVFEYTKATLKVTEVEDLYSICKYQKTQVERTALAISPLLTMTSSHYVPLNVNEEEIEPLSPIDPIIHVGDPIKRA